MIPANDLKLFLSRPRHRRGLAVQVTMVVAMIVGLAAVTIPSPCLSQEPGRSFTIIPADSLPLAITGRATGITWVGPDTLAIIDDIPDSLSETGHRMVRLVFQNRAGEPLLDKDFTGVLDRALAWDGEFLWGCGDNREGGSLLYKIRMDSLLVDQAYDLSGHRPTGMCFDGRYLWISDRDSGHLDRFDPIGEAITRSVPGPAFSPCGIAHLGRHKWLTDKGTGRIYRLTGGRCNWTGTGTADSFMQRGKEILLTNDDFSLYYVPYGELFVIRIVFQAAAP